MRGKLSNQINLLAFAGAGTALVISLGGHVPLSGPPPPTVRCYHAHDRLISDGAATPGRGLEVFEDRRAL
jgi:hypothetical protein